MQCFKEKCQNHNKNYLGRSQGRTVPGFFFNFYKALIFALNYYFTLTTEDLVFVDVKKSFPGDVWIVTETQKLFRFQKIVLLHKIMSRMQEK